MIGTRITVVGFASIAIAMAGFVFALHASYPGYLNADSAFQLEQAITWRFDDWHSPFVVMMWSILLKLLPGPIGFVTFNNVLIWSSAALLALVMRRRIGTWSILIVAVPLFPGLFNYLGNVHVDAMLVAWLMAASCAAYMSRREDCPPCMRIGLQALANLFIVAAFLTRLNAIFCLVPLLLYANARLGLRWNLMLCAALIVAMPALSKIQNKVLKVTPSSVVDSIKVYNLLALSYHERRNLFPGEWTEQQSREIINACYSSVQWDTAWTGQCGFIYAELQRQKLWGSSQLTRIWLREIFNHPGSYFSVLAATFKRSMFEPNSRAMLFKNPNRWMISDNPPRQSTELAQRYIRSEFNDRVGRPWVYVLISALSIVLLFRTRVFESEEGLFALAILTSGLVYLLTYFVFNVSAEYRYFYWSGFAAYIGLVVVLASISARARNRIVLESEKPDRVLRIPSLLIAALAAALVAFPYDLPVERRLVTVTPLDSKPVMVTGVHNAATPKWMNLNFEGQLDSMAWVHEGAGYRSSRTFSPLVIELETLKQDIEVVLATGPGMGTLAIEETGNYRQVDTAADQPGSTTVRLPPQDAAMQNSLRHAAINLAMALLLFLIFLVTFWKLGLPSPSRKPDTRCAPND